LFAFLMVIANLRQFLSQRILTSPQVVSLCD
jgi:hypothetical protein